jgi:hypothetical protein
MRTSGLEAFPLRCLLLGTLLLNAAVCAAETSQLWGPKGEAWKPDSRLPDFSFSGYHCGEAPIPKVPVVANVKDFGAIGDGKADDTEAFKKAVDKAKSGAIFIPEGRYVLTSPIDIKKSNIVLRGAGPDKTVLVIPKSLQQIAPKDVTDGFKSPYSFGGGFIQISGYGRGKKIGEVTEAAKRGDKRLKLASVPGVKTGAWIRVLMDNSKSLAQHLHAGQAEAGVATYKEKKNFVDWAVRVTAVAGTTIEIDRPLRFDVKPEWKAEVQSFSPSVEEVGIEDLAFEHAGVPKKDHLKEEGYNSIHIRGAVNSWVRNVWVTDADNGVILGGARFCTIEKLVFKENKRKGITGHHALWASGGAQDCLFTDFKVETKYHHDLTVEGCACGNVFSTGSGVALNFDHHRNLPYENLFTDLDCGSGKRVWDSSGRGDRGPHTGARETFWNIRCTDTFAKVPTDWPLINVIGMKGYKVETPADKAWIECVDGVLPPNLYLAQREKRLGPQAGGPTGDRAKTPSKPKYVLP